MLNPANVPAIEADPTVELTAEPRSGPISLDDIDTYIALCDKYHVGRENALKFVTHFTVRDLGERHTFRAIEGTRMTFNELDAASGRIAATFEKADFIALMRVYLERRASKQHEEALREIEAEFGDIASHDSV